eukprot:TRINITY_DN9195_c3_g1_i1.p1 TRINITY_DN9195_c3_g1~~TRINITY_DN9195_c3_g1_i1.p1  ORF type:complete len:100 (-),score=7.06 TRINITY_DN9195_c3_g1_i1:573-872(-)
MLHENEVTQSSHESIHEFFNLGICTMETSHLQDVLPMELWDFQSQPQPPIKAGSPELKGFHQDPALQPSRVLIGEIDLCKKALLYCIVCFSFSFSFFLL